MPWVRAFAPRKKFRDFAAAKVERHVQRVLPATVEHVSARTVIEECPDDILAIVLCRPMQRRSAEMVLPVHVDALADEACNLFGTAGDEERCEPVARALQFVDVTPEFRGVLADNVTADNGVRPAFPGHENPEGSDWVHGECRAPCPPASAACACARL